MITVLGSTGSIGTNTLDVVRQNPDRFRVFALAAGTNVDLLFKQIREFRPQVIVLPDTKTIDSLAALLADGAVAVPEMMSGPQALISIATAPEVNVVMSSIVGVAGLPATFAAVCERKRVGLANKEVLVSGGKLVMEAAERNGTDPDQAIMAAASG